MNREYLVNVLKELAPDEFNAEEIAIKSKGELINMIINIIIKIF